MTIDAPLLQAVGLCSGYRQVEILHGVDLSVSGGEVVALLGANGAGKTTLLLTLAGFLIPTSGEIRWNGNQGRNVPFKLARRGVAFVPERGIFQQLTVEGNLRLGRGDLQRFRIGRPDLQNLRLGRGDVERAYDVFPQLRALARRRAGLLSGGEQKMLALARALASGPSILMIDELSMGLAPVMVSRLLSVTRESADRGVGVLLVEQQVERVLSIADRGYLMNRGRIAFSGTRDELSERRDEIAGTYLLRAQQG